MCSPTSGGGPSIVPGVSEKCDQLAELAHRPHVAGARTRRRARAARCRRRRARARRPSCRPGSRWARRRRRARASTDRGPRRGSAARAGPRAASGARRRRSATAKRASSASSGSAERGAQRDPLALLHRRDLDPAVLRLVEAVAARRCPCWPWSRRGRGTASPSTSSASDANTAPPSSSDVHSSWPSPVAALVVQRGEAADDRQHRVRRVAHAEAGSRAARCRSWTGAGLVLEPGRRLVERVEPAEVRERTLEPVRPRVAVHDVGLHALAVFVADAEPRSRRRPSCCGARCRRARRARARSPCPAAS